MKNLFNPHYSGLALDRASELRARPNELARRIDEDGLKILPVYNGMGLIKGLEMERARPALLKKKLAAEVYEKVETKVFLGLQKNKAVFAALLAEEDKQSLQPLLEPYEFLDLRQISPHLKHSAAALLAYARGMEFWHRTNRFCGHCGSKTLVSHAGHVRKCQDESCGKEVFPRTDPAVIMLVETGEGQQRKCLLAHHARIPIKMYSTLAGFLEPGESLEEAVKREVFEEVGLEVEGVKYQGSQPWPFPASLMVGFRARAKSEDFIIDPEEIIAARWFTKEEIKEAEDLDGQTPLLILPPADSIARLLIRDWLEEEA